MQTLLLRRLTHLLTFIVIIASVVFLLHTEHFSSSLLLLAISYVLLVLHRDYLFRIDLTSRKAHYFFGLQLLLALLICYLSESYLAQLYLLVLIGEFAFYQPKLRALVFTIIVYLSIMTVALFYRSYTSVLSEIYLLLPRLIDFFAVYGMSAIAKIAIEQKEKLADDHKKLQLASIQLERKAKLQERTRIARDIHDSVGLTLTSAITGLQTAEYALQKNNYTLALDMISRTKDSVHNGLDDVRSSVHLLSKNVIEGEFITEFKALIQDTARQTNVTITDAIEDDLPELSPLVELTLYRALQEGLTNGLRHGSSTKFHCSLYYFDEGVIFTLEDNGKVPDQIRYGFGLKAMHDRVVALGGQLTVTNGSTLGGVELMIRIPFKIEEVMI